MDNSVFISYRREASEDVANEIFKYLSWDNINAFIDTENLGTGDWWLQILSEIYSRPYFILVLTPNSLQRCRDNKDYVLREIKYAMEKQRHFIPFCTPDFEIQDIDRFLPSNIAIFLKRQQMTPKSFFTSGNNNPIANACIEISIKYLLRIDFESFDPEKLLTDSERRFVSNDFYQISLRGRHDLDRVEYLDRAIYFNPQNTEALLDRATVRANSRDYNNALADLNAILKVEPDNSEAMKLKVKIQTRIGSFPNRNLDLTPIIDDNPHDDEAYVLRAESYARSKNYSEAFRDFEMAAKLNPRNIAALLGCYATLEITGQKNHAKPYLDQARNVDPNHPEVLSHSAFWNLERKNYKQAVIDFGRAIALDNNHFTSYFFRAQCYMEMKEYHLAIADFKYTLKLFENGIMIEDNSWESLEWIAIAYDKLGNKRSAASSYVEMLRRYPNSPHPNCKKIKEYISRHGTADDMMQTIFITC